ncbi:hypothetical protein ACJMK2_019470 [Sinanodonta woodiana]|uniref:Myb-like domain-containing protein n=1 Tax=Sinanodonta woodiana TaxID=1069815 RepID=A0ABD3TW46_SINWO
MEDECIDINSWAWQRRKRKQNFTATETDAILDMVEKYMDIVQSKHTDYVTNQKKQAIWLEITAAVNKIGATPRTCQEVKEKWRNVFQQAKRDYVEYMKNAGTNEQKDAEGQKGAENTNIQIHPVSMRMINMLKNYPGFTQRQDWRDKRIEAVNSSGGHDRLGFCNVSQRSFFEDTRMDEEDSSSNSSLHANGNGYSFRANQPGNGSILVGHTVGQQGARSSHSRLITDHNISNDNIRQRNFSNPLNEHHRRHEKISIENIKHEVIEIFDLDTNDSPQPDDEMRSSPSPNVQSTEGSSHGTPQSSTENTGTLLLSSSPPALLDVHSMASAYNCDVGVSIPSNLYHNRAQSQDNSTAQIQSPIQSPQPFQGQKDNSTIFILPNDDHVDQTPLQSSHVHADEHNKKTENGSSGVQEQEIIDRRLQTFKHENDFSRKRTLEDMGTEVTFPTTRDVLKMQYEVLIEEKKKIRLEQRNLNLRNRKLRLDIKRLEKELESSL